MKKLFKRLFKTAFFSRLMVTFAACYIRFVYFTSRVRIEVDEAAADYMASRTNAVMAFWHGRMLMIPPVYPPGRRMNVLISTHRDGEMIAQTMHRFGFTTIRGSSTRGGARAAIQAVRALKAGENVAFTPDGPKGPAMKLQPGVLMVAELANVPIVIFTYSATRHKRMKSWDGFLLALPFSTLYYKISAPVKNSDAAYLENEMVRLTREMDIKAGIHPAG